jgi:hypothetical protein
VQVAALHTKRADKQAEKTSKTLNQPINHLHRRGSCSVPQQAAIVYSAIQILWRVLRWHLRAPANCNLQLLDWKPMMAHQGKLRSSWPPTKRPSCQPIGKLDQQSVCQKLRLLKTDEAQAGAPLVSKRSRSSNPNMPSCCGWTGPACCAPHPTGSHVPALPPGSAQCRGQHRMAPWSFASASSCIRGWP